MENLLSIPKAKIRSFTGLEAWKIGHQFVLMIYRETKQFPAEEQFSLTNQIRRAGVSITSNIAEGFSRRFNREKIQFYSIALSSLTEVQNQLLIAKDVSYLSHSQFHLLAQQSVRVGKLIHGLMRSAATKSDVHS